MEKQNRKKYNKKQTKLEKACITNILVYQEFGNDRYKRQ